MSSMTDNQMAGQDNADGAIVPNEWSEDTIERKVFTFLSQQLASDWRHFIMRLPGWPESVSVSSVIENKIEEEHTVPNRIMGCLVKWKKSVDPTYVCRDSILQALRDMGDVSLAEKLDETISPSLM